MNHSDESKLCSGILALAAAALFFIACLKLPALSSAISGIGNLNMITYAGTVVLFCLTFWLFYKGFSVRPVSLSPSNVFRFLFPTVLLIGSLFFIAVSFLTEGNLAGGVTYKFIWHNLPFPFVGIMVLILASVFLGLWKFRDFSADSRILWLYYGALTLLMWYTSYTPNIFGRYLASDAAHGHAYYNSIYNVYHGCAYTETTTSIYGHYALFYKLPMKILGGSFLDFIFLNACLCALCFFFAFAALHLIVQNNMIRILGCLAMTLPVLSMRGGFYWQLWPHRILFASLLTFFAAWCIRYRKLNRATWLLGYVISWLGVIWNTEGGIICAVAWAGLWMLHYFCSEGRTVLRLLYTICCQALAVAAAFFGAYGAVGLYNILQECPPNSIREFLFPLVSASYMTDLLRLDLPLYPTWYMLVVILFLIGCAWGISCMKWFSGSRHNGQTFHALPCFCFFLSVLSLGQMTYFMNRPAYHNLDICHIPAVMILCVLTQLGLPLLKNRSVIRKGTAAQLFKSTIALLSAGTLFVLCMGTVIQYSYNADIKKNFHNLDELRELADTIALDVPPHTYAFGVCAAEIYSLLGWSTNCYTLDFTDLSLRPEVADFVVKDMQEKEITEVFAGQGTVEKMEKFAPEAAEWFTEHFELQKEYPIGDSTFQYYRVINQEGT